MVNTNNYLFNNLKEINEKYQAFLRDYGEVENLNTNNFSSEKKEQCRKQAKCISKLSRKIKANIHYLLTQNELPIYSDSEGLLETYEKEIKPLTVHFSKISNQELSDLFNLIKPEELPPGTSAKPILKDCFSDLVQDAFSEIYQNDGNYMSLKWAPRETELDSLLGITSSLYFEPDIWLSNLSAIQPIAISKSADQLPAHVRTRLKEVFRTYTFGCWFSCIATSRALFEYCIIDRANTLGINPYEDASEKKTRRLSHIIDSIDNDRSSLKKDMQKIREYGNEAMHPIKAKKSKCMVFGQPQALDCLKSLSNVLSILYPEN